MQSLFIADPHDRRRRAADDLDEIGRTIRRLGIARSKEYQAQGDEYGSSVQADSSPDAGAFPDAILFQTGWIKTILQGPGSITIIMRNFTLTVSQTVTVRSPLHQCIISARKAEPHEARHYWREYAKDTDCKFQDTDRKLNQLEKRFTI